MPLSVGSLCHRTGEIQGGDDQGFGSVTSLFLTRYWDDGTHDETRNYNSGLVMVITEGGKN